MSLTVKILEKQAGTLTKTAHAWLGGLITSETSGYAGVYCDIAHSTTAHRWTATGTSSTAFSLDYDTAVACAEGDVIYIMARVRTTTAGVNTLRLVVDGTTGGQIVAATQSVPVQGSWYSIYGTVTLDGTYSGNIRLRWLLIDASGATGSVLQVSNWHAINLTDQFGAGDEPDAADLSAFYEWRWELMTYKNHNLYNATYGDKMYCASKIADHGLEYNDVVRATHNTGGGADDVYYVSPVYPLNSDWIITQINEYPGGGMNEGFYEPTSFEYWAKTDYTSRVRAKSLQINVRDDLEASASMSFNCDTDWQPEIGMTVAIYDDTETLFTGHISQISKQKLSFGHWKAEVTVAPLMAALQWVSFLFDKDSLDYILALATPSTRNTLELLMVFVSGYPTAWTGGQAVWIGAFDDGNTTVTLPDPLYKTVYELFNSTCTSAGLALLMTPDRRLKCVRYDTSPGAAPRNISDAAETDIRDVVYTDDVSTYGNLVVMRGGYDANGAPVAVLAANVAPPVTDDIYAAQAYKTITVSDNSITNETDAGNAAIEVAKKTALVTPGTLTFTTDYTDFRPGQKIEVDLDDWGITSTKTMLIDSVVLYDADGINLQSNVTCSNRDATDFAAAPNKGSTAYMSELSSKVTQSVSAVQQQAGSFKPTMYGGTTAGTWAYTTQQGYYIKVGSLCYVYIRLKASSISGAVGTLRVGDLPFAASPAAAATHLSAFTTGLAWGTNMTQLQLIISTGNSHGSMYGSGNNLAWTAVDVTDITTSDEIRISGVYLV